MAAGEPAGMRKPNPMKRVRIPTDKLVVAIVQMFQTEDKEMKKSALQLASYIFETYDDNSEMKKDIYAAFVTKRELVPAMRSEIERRYPEETELLKQIFGAFLFGG